MDPVSQYEAVLAENFQYSMDIGIDDADVGFNMQSLSSPSTISYEVGIDPEDLNINHASQMTWDVSMIDPDPIDTITAHAEVGLSKPRTKRSKGPPAEQWERQRGLITELYRDRDLRLEDVQALMKEQHGFDATVQMYKKRLNDWQVRKYYTQEQKLEVISNMQRRTLPASAAINGKPLKWSRLRRPVRRNGIRIALVSNSRVVTPAQIGPRLRSDTTASQDLLRARNGRDRENDSRADSRSKVRVQYQRLQQSPESWKVELILRYANHYYGQGFSEDGDVTAVFHPLQAGLSFLSDDRRRAFCFLNQACGAALGVLKALPGTFLQSLLVLLADPGWLAYREVKRLVMRHFAETAAHACGGSHPLASILKICFTEQNIDNMLPNIVELVLDVICGMSQSSTEEWVKHQLRLAEYHIFQNKIEAAETEVRRSLTTIDQRLGRRHWLHARAIPFLAETLRVQRRWDEAEQHLLALIGHFSGQANGHRLSLWDLSGAYRGLANVYEDKGETGIGIRYTMQALDLMSQFFCNDWHPEVIRVLVWAEYMLARIGTTEELEQLHADYAHVWKAIEEWELRPEEEQ